MLGSLESILIAPTAFLEPEQADQLADRLARSGVNLVRLGDLDTALGPNLSLFDDTRDDTKAFDPNSLAKLDHLIAAFKAARHLCRDRASEQAAVPR